MKLTNKLAALIAATLMFVSVSATAAAPQTLDLTANFLKAGATIDRLQVYELAGIVIIRGRAANASEAELLSRHAQSLGYTRVANLVQIVKHDDEAMVRKAEVELSVHRSLDGCRFSVTANQGVLRVAGSVRHELQKDAALAVLRSIDGVRSVEMSLNKF